MGSRMSILILPSPALHAGSFGRPLPLTGTFEQALSSQNLNPKDSYLTVTETQNSPNETRTGELGRISATL